MATPHQGLAEAVSVHRSGAECSQSNCSQNLTSEVDDDFTTSNLAFKVVICTFYASIFLLGVFGNALVCFVVFRNRMMQTVTNLFITNLALSDILLCILAVPFTPLYTFIGSWVFGDSLCHLVPYAQGVSIYISTLTLTGIAVDRFLVILYPFRPRMKISTCLSIIVAIWVIALLVTLPYGMYVQPQSDTSNNGNRYCEEAWPDEPFRMTFSLLTSVLQFGLPFIVISCCYICVSIRLNDRAKMKPGSKTSRTEEADRERKKRTNRMLIAMVAIFGFSWLPLNIVNMVEDFYQPAIDWKYYKVLFFMAHCLAMSSTCYNPFLYAWLNDNFRKEFKQVLPCFRRAGDRGARGLGPGGFCGARSERTCNGVIEQTCQESLLPSHLPKQYSGCEMISLEPTTNLTKDLD